MTGILLLYGEKVLYIICPIKGCYLTFDKIYLLTGQSFSFKMVNCKFLISLYSSWRPSLNTGMVSSLRYSGERARCTRVQSSQGWFGGEENKIIVKVFSKYQVQKTESSWEFGPTVVIKGFLESSHCQQILHTKIEKTFPFLTYASIEDSQNIDSFSEID